MPLFSGVTLNSLKRLRFFVYMECPYKWLENHNSVCFLPKKHTKARMISIHFAFALNKMQNKTFCVAVVAAAGESCLPSSFCYILNYIYLCTQHKTIQFVCKLCWSRGCLESFNLLFIFVNIIRDESLHGAVVIILINVKCIRNVQSIRNGTKIATTSFCLDFLDVGQKQSR